MEGQHDIYLLYQFRLKNFKLSILKNYKAQPRLSKGALGYETLGYKHNDYDFTFVLGSLVSI